MRVEIQLQLQAAVDLQQGGVSTKKGSPSGSSALDLKRAIERLGLKLEPVNPGQIHPLLAPYFKVEVPDRQTAQDLMDRLNQYQIVEAAYLRPEESAP